MKILISCAMYESPVCQNISIKNGSYTMKIIKRSGKEVVFDRRKIVSAIERANTEVAEKYRLSGEQINRIDTCP